MSGHRLVVHLYMHTLSSYYGVRKQSNLMRACIQCKA